MHWRDHLRTFRDREIIRQVRASAPPDISHLLHGARVLSLRDSLRVKRHSMFAVGRGAILHIYDRRVSPICRALAERKQLGSPRLLRIPTILADAVGPLPGGENDDEAVWLIESRLAGVTATSATKSSWRGKALEALADLARRKGPPLAGSPFEQAHRMPSIDAAPCDLKSAIRASWDRLADIATVPLHGDVQPKNLIDGPKIGLIDWEGFWLCGLPLHDLAFLAAMGEPVRPSADRLAQFLRGDGPFRAFLDENFENQRQRQDLMLVTLSLWHQGEIRKISRDGRADAQRPFAGLLREFAPILLENA